MGGVPHCNNRKEGPILYLVTGEKPTHIFVSMVRFTTFLGYLLAINMVINCVEIPEDLMEDERKAFALCDMDKMVGLTWREVENCEERLGDMLLEKGIPLPSKEDFDNADLNGDGTLLFEEWEESIMESLEYDDENDDDDNDDDESS